MPNEPSVPNAATTAGRVANLAACLTLALLAGGFAPAAAAPIAVVAAEAVYGDVAGQIGGAQVVVTSILRSPDQDPHLFELTPSVARNVAAARIVIYNGADYDPWMATLLHAAGGNRRTIVVADLAGRKPGDNPHVWYDPDAVLRFATAFADALGAADPEHRAEYQQRLAAFRQAMQPVLVKIAALRTRLAGTPVTATEPVFGDMFAALGMPVRNLRFQRAVMNDTEPSAADVAALEDELKRHRVALLAFNRQAATPLTRRMLRIAEAAHVPVLAVSETEPPGMSYQAWLLSALDALDQELRQ